MNNRSSQDRAGQPEPVIAAHETPRERLCRELKERVAKGEYWVDLDFLACLLVDSATAPSKIEE
jgi:anti-sigma28 factor (negative regulator of flagellin synthesis)